MEYCRPGYFPVISAPASPPHHRTPPRPAEEQGPGFVRAVVASLEVDLLGMRFGQARGEGEGGVAAVEPVDDGACMYMHSADADGPRPSDKQGVRGGEHCVASPHGARTLCMRLSTHLSECARECAGLKSVARRRALRVAEGSVTSSSSSESSSDDAEAREAREAPVAARSRVGRKKPVARRRGSRAALLPGAMAC